MEGINGSRDRILRIGSRWRHASWPTFYVVSALVLGYGVYAASLPGLDLTVIGQISVGLLVIGAIWTLGIAVASPRPPQVWTARDYARWLAVPFAAFVSPSLVLAQVPFAVRFNLSRAELERTASRVETTLDAGHRWVGLMPVDAIEEARDGTVIFLISGDEDLAGDPCGIAYNPRHMPNEDGGTPGRQITNGWWSWCERM